MSEMPTSNGTALDRLQALGLDLPAVGESAP
jgi:hypothetical protein